MTKLAHKLIDLYKKYLAPINFGFHTCRYIPSCSDYTKQSIEKYGLLKGSFKGFLRILRCNPLFKGGVDMP